VGHLRLLYPPEGVVPAFTRAIRPDGAQLAVLVLGRVGAATLGASGDGLRFAPAVGTVLNVRVLPHLWTRQLQGVREIAYRRDNCQILTCLVVRRPESRRSSGRSGSVFPDGTHGPVSRNWWVPVGPGRSHCRRPWPAPTTGSAPPRRNTPVAGRPGNSRIWDRCGRRGRVRGRTRDTRTVARDYPPVATRPVSFEPPSWSTVGRYDIRPIDKGF